jgi:hypothetical protein
MVLDYNVNKFSGNTKRWTLLCNFGHSEIIDKPTKLSDIYEYITSRVRRSVRYVGSY